jgi:hypothetical protein
MSFGRTYIVLIVPRISQKTMKNDNSSLDLAFHDTISIRTMRIVVDQSERIILAAWVVDLEERNLCIINSWKIGADDVSGILLCKYGSAAAQQKERGQKLHYSK